MPFFRPSPPFVVSTPCFLGSKFEVFLTKSSKYFASKKTVYDVLSNEVVGITYKTLLNCVMLSDGPYENKKCIIRQVW